jgi:hypothetical protein
VDRLATCWTDVDQQEWVNVYEHKNSRFTIRIESDRISPRTVRLIRIEKTSFRSTKGRDWRLHEKMHFIREIKSRY